MEVVLAREVYCWVRDSNSNENLKFKGFLDRDQPLNKHNLGCLFRARRQLSYRFERQIFNSDRRLRTEKSFCKAWSRELNS